MWFHFCGDCKTASHDGSSESVIPDFTGEWISSNWDGDVDAYLCEMGANFFERAGARLRSYDVGKTVIVLRQEGNNVDIDVRGRRKYTQILSVGGGPQVCEDENGAILADPVWQHDDAGCVLALSITNQDGSKPRMMRLWTTEDEMVIDYSTKSASVRFLYTRRGGTSKSHYPIVAPPPPPIELLKNGKPDFSGTWKSQACEGDMDAFFDDMGVGKAGRTAMSAIGYGVGMVQKIIKQAGDEMQITDDWPTGPTTQSFRIGTGEQITVGTQGKELYVTPSWEHNHVLRVITQPISRSESPMSSTRYFFEGQMLIVMFESKTGRTVKYRYKRM